MVVSYLTHGLDLSILDSHRLFQTEPDLKRLFPKIVQMNEKNELEWEVDKDMLQVGHN